MEGKRCAICNSIITDYTDRDVAEAGYCGIACFQNSVEYLQVYEHLEVLISTLNNYQREALLWLYSSEVFLSPQFTQLCNNMLVVSHDEESE